MTRTLNSSLLTDLTQDAASLVAFIELQLSTGSVYLCTGAVNLTFGGHTYTAVGGALTVDGLGETTDEKGQGVSLTLSGVEQTALASLLAAKVRGRKAIVNYAHFSPSTGALIGAAYEAFNGYMNETWTITDSRTGTPDGGGDVKITTRLTSRLTDLDRVKGFAMNNAEYQQFYAGDTFFATVPGLIGQQIRWGQSPAPGANPSVQPPGPWRNS